MANMSMTKNPIPEQEPLVRNKNFDEVALGYTEEIAIDEAKRCLNCRQHPCVSGCPVNVRIPEFIAKVAEGEFEEAYKIITSTNSLPAVCGRVCPQEHQCEGKCVRGIKGESVGIGRLRALRRRLARRPRRPQREGREARFQRPPCRRRRFRPCRSDLRGRPRPHGL